jgi:SAM-dependent methyltransferase
VPHSTGYEQYKEEYIARALANPSVIERFKTGAQLPIGYGIGLDERCVEFPWVLSRLGEGEERLLDAGSVLNHAFLISHPLLQSKRMYIVTLAPEHVAFWQQGISYLYEDLRDLPMRAGLYDAVVCLSTLEHVGMDASFYTHRPEDREERPGDYLKALAELKRVIRPGGTLFLSVPYGVYCDIGVMQVFDERMISRVIEAFGPEQVEATYYRYRAEGWEVSDAAACADAEYVDAYFRYFSTHTGQNPEGMPREGDLAAGARAVACLVLVKGAEDRQAGA